MRSGPFHLTAGRGICCRGLREEPYQSALVRARRLSNFRGGQFVRPVVGRAAESRGAERGSGDNPAMTRNDAMIRDGPPRLRVDRIGYLMPPSESFG